MSTLPMSNSSNVQQTMTQQTLQSTQSQQNGNMFTNLLQTVSNLQQISAMGVPGGLVGAAVFSLARSAIQGNGNPGQQSGGGAGSNETGRSA
ncbi:hypothetical protein [Salinarimonas soli]|uniref:Uncharacterized protein n=1 Tax=Salinarimonas soli TaxID=1638099 RepID=A0A5B2VCR1_9HYPH|nr:hypothetical protein [Salinarimonas soli]KAA2236548.1 hypothetical protein F0L46_13810 [Salinarimonas soli]